MKVSSTPDEQVLVWRKSSGIIRLRLMKGAVEAVQLQREDKQPAGWLPVELVLSAAEMIDPEVVSQAARDSVRPPLKAVAK